MKKNQKHLFQKKLYQKACLNDNFYYYLNMKENKIFKTREEIQQVMDQATKDFLPNGKLYDYSIRFEREYEENFIRDKQKHLN